MDTISIRARFTGDASKPWACQDEAWRQPAEPWLLAHDLYHHKPNDTGTIQQEIETLGAEYYIYFERGLEPWDHDRVAPSGWNALGENAGGIIGLALDATEPGGDMAPEDFRFRANTKVLAEVPEIAAAVFEHAGDSAVSMMEQFQQGMSVDDPWRAALHRAQKPAVLAALMARGYLAAKKRFPARDRAREAFTDSVKRITSLAGDLNKASGQQVGAEYRFTRQKYTLLIERLSPVAP